MLNEKKVVPKLRQEVKVKVDIVSSDDIKIYYTGNFQDFTARYIKNTFTTKSRLLTRLEKKNFKNIVGKGENAGNQHFLLFQQCFLLFPTQISIFESHLFCRLLML